MSPATATKLCELYNKIYEATSSRSWFELKEARLEDLKKMAIEWIRTYKTLAKNERGQLASRTFAKIGVTGKWPTLTAETWMHLYGHVKKWLDDAGVELDLICRLALAKSERSITNAELFEFGMRSAQAGVPALWDPTMHM